MARVYYMTHWRNLNRIMKDGLCCEGVGGVGQGSGAEGSEARGRRERLEVPVGPAGRRLGEFVPFSFGPRGPVLYYVHKSPDANGGVDQRELIYLVTTVASVESAGIDFVFTDGDSKLVLTEFYDDLEDLEKVDFEAAESRYWADTDGDPDLKRRKQAEFLIHEGCPWQLVAEIGVRDVEMKAAVEQLISADAHRPDVVMRKQWYY